MKKKKRTNKKKIIMFSALFFIIFLSIIIQVFFTPKWVDGNVNKPTTAEQGVHTQTSQKIEEDANVKLISYN